MKTALFCDSFLPVVDGVAIAVQNYAKWLNLKYGECCVIAPGFPEYIDCQQYEIKRFSSVSVPSREPYRVGMPTIDIEYNRWVKKKQFDIIHAHSPFMSGWEARRLSLDRGVPLVVTFHSKFYDDFKQALKSDFITRKVVDVIMAFFNRADSVWTVNESTAETLREYGYKGDIIIMPNGSDMEYPENPQKYAAMAEGFLNIRPEDRLLLFVGQLIWQKNTKLIIEALQSYRAEGGKFKMAFVGTGYAEEDLKKLAKEAGMEEDIIFTGPVLDREMLRSIYLRANLFVFPSIYDNAPLVVREAAAMHCPAILVAGSNASEGIIDNENGFLCEANYESLKNRIAQVLRDDALLRRVGIRACETVATPWEKIVDRVHDKYVEIIDEFKHRQKKPKRAVKTGAEQKGKQSSAISN